jgi:6-phosphogluconolactonase
MSHLNTSHILIVGTYTDSLPHVEARGRGIHLFGFDGETGQIVDGPVIEGMKNPTYLNVSRDGTLLYAVQEMGEADGAAVDVFALDSTGSEVRHLTSRPAQGSWPCHVGLDLDERRLYVSNYLSGSFVAYPLDPDGIPADTGLKIQRSGTGPNPDRQEGPHVHQGVPTPDGLHVLICDAGTDTIARHRLVGDSIDPEPNLIVEAAGGSLPRHLAFLTDGSGFLVQHELDGTVVSYRYGSETIEKVATVSALPVDWTGVRSGAAIRAHPEGRFVYASNRGHDSIVGFDLAGGLANPIQIGWWSTAGATPRDFIISEDGRFLIAANQDGDNLTVFAIDAGSGALRQVGTREGVGSPVCVQLVARR